MTKKTVVILLQESKDNTDILEYLNKLGDHFSFVVYKGSRGDPFPDLQYIPSVDILVSYLSPWIVSQETLDKTKLWNINFHTGGPDFPGIGCTNFAIYEGKKEYGVTAHLMKAKVDTGKILNVRRFPIASNETVYTLTQKSYLNLTIVFYDVFNYIVKHGDIPSCSEKWSREPFRRTQLEDLCKITPDMSKDEIYRRIKATDYPGMPGAYIELDGIKFTPNYTR